MKVLLTGASGFIGASLTRLLVSEGCRVHALARPGSNLERIQDLSGGALSIELGDVLTPDQMTQVVARVQPELCFHLAWYAEPGVYQTSPLNIPYVAASLDLASQLAAAGCRRLVVAGTCAEYDADNGYLAESSPTRPATLYAASKVALHTLLARLAERIGLEVTWPRIFYVYGPGEDARRFIPAVINAVLAGEPTRLTPGEQVRDYLHVDDVASALWALARSSLTGAVNVGSGNPVTNRDIALRIGDILQRPELVKFGDLAYRPGDPMFVCANNRLLLSGTDWRPRYDIDAGLCQTATWWRNHVESRG